MSLTMRAWYPRGIVKASNSSWRLTITFTLSLTPVTSFCAKKLPSYLKWQLHFTCSSKISTVTSKNTERNRGSMLSIITLPERIHCVESSSRTSFVRQNAFPRYLSVFFLSFTQLPLCYRITRARLLFSYYIASLYQQLTYLRATFTLTHHRYYAWNIAFWKFLMLWHAISVNKRRVWTYNTENLG